MEPIHALVVRARGGDPEAFDRIVDHVLPEFHQLAVMIVGPADADDVAQDALVATWRELPRLRDTTRFEPWARRVLVNHCRDALRRRRRGVRRLETMLPDEGDGRNRLAARGPEIERDLDLRAAIAHLDPALREVVALHYAGGLTLGETAEALAIPEGTVKSRLNRALEALRRELAEAPS